jgi:uncharacterized protein (DUF433 family)
MAIAPRQEDGMELESYFEFHSPDSIRLKGHRIEVEHVIEFYHEGFSPEAIVQELPSLSLEKIHATITYYLHNKAEVDQYMARRRAEATRRSQEHDQQEPSPALQRLRKRREEQAQASRP